MAIKKKKNYREVLYELQKQAVKNNVKVSNDDLEKAAQKKALAIDMSPVSQFNIKSNSNPRLKQTQALSKSGKEDKSWFSAGAFDDGYQFGDVTKTILGTAGDVGLGVVKGLAKLGEGIGDLGVYGVAQVGDWLGYDEWADSRRKAASRSLIDEITAPADKLLDRHSVIGERGDDITQGIGQVAGIMVTGGAGASAGLGSVGTTILTSGVTGLSSMGSGMSEAYLGGATDEEAARYGAIVGAGDAITELFFGGLGKSLNVLGLGRGLSSADDMLAKKISSKFSSQIAKNFTEYGIKAGAEGTEEVLAGIISAAGKKITYMSEEDFSKILEDERLLDQFIAGAITSGIAQSGIVPSMKQGSLIEANKTGRDFVTGYTQNEQSIIDSLVKEQTDAIAKNKTLEDELNKTITSREKSQGGILSDKNKNALRESILSKIENGEIDTSNTKINKKELLKIQEDVKKNLSEGKYGLSKIEDILTPTETAQIKELEQALENVKEQAKRDEIQARIDELKMSKLNSLKGMVENNQFLNKAVYEAEMSQQAYSFDDAKVTDEYEKGVRENAKSFLSNATEARKFVDNIAKLAKDRQKNYRFTNNQELLEQGDLVENTNLTQEQKNLIQKLEKQLESATTEQQRKEIQNRIIELKYLDVGGFVRKTTDGKETVLLNVDSKQSLSAVVGHETKHLLERNSLNKDFNKLLFNYAKSKGDYDTYKSRVERLYEGVANADIEGEIAAALTGDYLFTDSKFLESLLNDTDTNTPKIIQKLKELIDDLVIRFKGTEQEKQLREVQKTFKELYKQKPTEQQNVATKDTKYSLSEKGTLQDSNGNDVTLKANNTGTTGNLLAIHGLSATNLKSVLALGGFPVPSIGITQANNASVIEEFGGKEGITVVFDKSTIDPKIKANEVYSNDVYSKTIPITYQKVDNRALKKVIDEFYPYESEYGSLNKHDYSKSSLESIVNDLSYSSAVKAKFLEDNGYGIKKVYKDFRSGYYSFTAEEIENFKKKYPDLASLNEYSADTSIADQIREITLDMMAESDPEVPRETFAKLFKEKFYLNDVIKFYRDIKQYDNANKGQEFDSYATRDNINEAVKEHEEEFNQWLTSKFENLYGDKYFENENGRKYDYTLENLTSYMKKGVTKTQQKGMFNTFGVGQAKASASRRFKSLDQIRSESQNLVDAETYTERRKAFEDIDDDVRTEIGSERISNGEGVFEVYSDYYMALAEAASKNVTSEEALNHNWFKNVTKEQIDKFDIVKEQLMKFPAKYFEAKPQRAVGLNEIQALVVPNTLEATFKQQLIDNGYNVIEYDPNIEGDRTAKINELDNLKFSLSNPNEQIAPTGNYNVYGEDVKFQQAIAPLQEEIQTLTETVTELKEQLAPVKEEVDEFAAVSEEQLPMLEEFYNESFRNIDESTIPETEGIADYESFDVSILDADAKEIIRDYTGNNARKTNTLYKEIAAAKNIDEAIEILEDYKDIYEEDVERKEVKKVIRDTKLDVSSLKKQVTDYNDFRKSNFGKLRLGNDGLEVDVFYQELSSMYPQYFDPEVVNPAEQLEALADFMHSDNSYIVDRVPQEAIENDATKLFNTIKLNEIEKQYQNIPIDDSIAPVEDVENSVDKVSNSNIAEKIAPVKEEYLAITPEKEPRLKRVNDNPTYNQIAEVLVNEPKTESDRNKRKWAIFKANILDKGAVFEDLSLKENNRELMGKWDYTLTSEARGQYVIGNGHDGLSKSLNDIRAEVDNTGLTKEFYEYMYHKHNVDRMSLATRFEGMENKPVFGDSVTSEQSQAIVDRYEKTHPEFMDFAQDVYDYVNADRQQLVDNGVISQETADLWSEMYPHYVPTRRTTDTGMDINVPLDTRRTGINAPIKKATGGSSDILPLFDTMAMRTLQTYKATAKNNFGVELMNTLGTTIESAETNVDEVIDSIDAQDGLLQEGKKGKNPTFTVFENGEKVTFEITKDMYDALKPISESSILSKTFLPTNIAGNVHRGLLTEYNPTFMLTNAIKDVQDVLLNSQHAAKTYAKIPEAYKQIATKGYWYQEYIRNGGEQNSYFDNESNTFKTENKGLKKLLDLPPLSTISKINNFIEMSPRLAEYIASREAGRSVEVSMLDAARVTTNFKAGGAVTKWANRNGATFLNASVQGAMQQIRNIREAKANGLKGWVNLATKFAIAGLPAMILNNLVWDDDEEYDELSDYVKQNYYIIGKNDDGTFIRIPKGRTVAVIQEGLNQMGNLITGNDEADLKSFIDLTLNNLAPNNPIENNVFSPIIQAATNKTWYGGDLVSSRLQKLPTAEQYDESTDAFSRWLGEKLDISPVKINYVLDQYSGGIGDIFLPMMTPEAEADGDSVMDYAIAPLRSKFTTNSIMNNQNISDFYDTSDKLTIDANKTNASDEDVLKNKYMNSIKAEMNKLYQEKREVQNDTSLSNSEKYQKVLEIQKQINELSKEGLSEYSNVSSGSNYSTVGDREYYKKINSEGEVEWTKVDDDEAKDLNGLGMSRNAKNTYFKTKTEINESIKDVDDADAKKTQVIDSLLATDLNNKQKAYLYGKYYSSDETLDKVTSSGIAFDNYLTYQKDTLYLDSTEAKVEHLYKSKYSDEAKTVLYETSVLSGFDNEDKYKDYKIAKATGVDINSWLSYKKQEFVADKDSDGKSISGSRKEKIVSYINSLDLSIPQKAILIRQEYPTYDDYNYQIIKYIGNLDISYEEKVTILEGLDMKVDANGNVTWE